MATDNHERLRELWRTLAIFERTGVDWRPWYHGLDDEDRALVDKHPTLAAERVAIALQEFSDACYNVFRPAMEAFLDAVKKLPIEDLWEDERHEGDEG